MDKAVFTVDLNNPGIVDLETTETKNGINEVSRKSIIYNDFLRLVNESLTAQSKLRIGKLPEGFYDGSIDSDEMGFHCVIIIPEEIKPLKYFDDLYMVPFPALLFNIIVRFGVVKKSEVYALQTDHATDKTSLYTYPFGNVYDDAHICWGSNVLDNIRTIRDCEKIVSMFFGSSTNDDLWSSATSIKTGENITLKLQRGLLEYLSNKKRFPKKLLREKKFVIGDLFKEENISKQQ